MNYAIRFGLSAAFAILGGCESLPNSGTLSEGFAIPENQVQEREAGRRTADAATSANAGARPPRRERARTARPEIARSDRNGRSGGRRAATGAATPSATAPSPGVDVPGGAAAAVEDMISRLRATPIQYDRPSAMTRGETREIRLSAGFKGVRRVSARLSGAAFAIDPKEAESRPTTASAVSWTWQATPIEEGDAQPLTLELYAHIEHEGREIPPVRFRTFRDRIVVEASGWDRFVGTVRTLTPAQALSALSALAIGSALFLLVARRRRQQRGGA